MKKIVITGGAGYIGSHIVERFAADYPAARIVVLDKMTYAAHIDNIKPLVDAGRVELHKNDICDLAACEKAVQGADLVIHAAAESHVDNSFSSSLVFTHTNVYGTHCVMEACRTAGVPKIIHVSTDEVYGEIVSGAVTEEAVFKPTNPYSASKAAAEMVINGYRQSYKLPVTVIRANNIFGIRQFPEKIIPKFILSLMTGQKLTLHGTGQNQRHYLSAHDIAAALALLAQGNLQDWCFNIGTTEEYTNNEMAAMICGLFGLDAAEEVTHVADRPFNDARYAVDWSRISALGWKPQHKLVDELPTIAAWYAENAWRYIDPAQIVRRPLKS
ncbi:MAG: GDP-mannose 4,6-dehydratase [Alphaproteobacteria bacterium]|nr:GDP-mannose 4,6-dehydratase [Alphaproteobacteria bacterium]MBU0859526.1 GDP-mannose 4,6-dehydratase [Alphaproteobacteria bacterium]